MKKMMTAFLFVCGLSVLPAQQAVIREVSGKVEIQVPGGDWVPAAPGQRMEKAAMISTGFKSTARISLGNSVLTVRPLTRLTLEELTASQGNETVNLSLQSGRVHADVTPPSGGKTEFTVRSPSATASVRGTSFDFDGTRLAVAQGRVRLSGGDRTAVVVSAGHRVTTDPISGKTPRVSETIRSGLTPAKPAGTDNAAASPIPGSPPSAALGPLEVGTTWL